MHKYITVDDIYNLFGYIADDSQNPFSDNGECVYTSEDGYHCIVGDILIKLGFELPDADDFQNSIPVDQLIDNLYANDFDDDAVEMLIVGQRTADRLTYADDPLAWGMAKIEMMNYRLRSREEEIAQRRLQAGH